MCEIVVVAVVAIVAVVVVVHATRVYKSQMHACSNKCRREIKFPSVNYVRNGVYFYRARARAQINLTGIIVEGPVSVCVSRAAPLHSSPASVTMTAAAAVAAAVFANSDWSRWCGVAFCCRFVYASANRHANIHAVAHVPSQSRVNQLVSHLMNCTNTARRRSISAITNLVAVRQFAILGVAMQWFDAYRFKCHGAEFPNAQNAFKFESPNQPT